MQIYLQNSSIYIYLVKLNEEEKKQVYIIIMKPVICLANSFELILLYVALKGDINLPNYPL